MSYEWKLRGRLVRGKAPARLQRLFMWDDEEIAEEGERRLMAETNYMWDYKSLAEVLEYDKVIPAAVLAAMRDDPRKYLEGDLSTAEEFEAIVSDAPVYRESDADEIPDADADACIRVGAVSFETSRDDATVITKVAGYWPWAAGVALERAAPPEVRSLLVKPSGVQPAAA